MICKRKSMTQDLVVPRWNTPVEDHLLVLRQIALYMGENTTVADAIKAMSKPARLDFTYEQNTQTMVIKNLGGNMKHPMKITITDIHKTSVSQRIQLGAGQTWSMHISGLYGQLTVKKGSKEHPETFMATPKPDVYADAAWRDQSSVFVINLMNRGGSPHEPLDVYFYQDEICIGTAALVGVELVTRRFRPNLKPTESAPTFDPAKPIRIEIIGIGTIPVPVPPKPEPAAFKIHLVDWHNSWLRVQIKNYGGIMQDVQFLSVSDPDQDGFDPLVSEECLIGAGQIQTISVPPNKVTVDKLEVQIGSQMFSEVINVPERPQEVVASAGKPRFERHPIVSNGSLYFLPITSWSTTPPRNGLNYSLELAGTEPTFKQNFSMGLGQTVMLLVENVVPNRQVGIWIDGDLYGFEMVHPLSGFSYDIKWNDNKLWIYVTRQGESMTEPIVVSTCNVTGGSAVSDDLYLEKGRMKPVLLSDINAGDYVEMCNLETNELLFAFVVPSRPTGNVASHSLTLVTNQPTCLP